MCILLQESVNADSLDPRSSNKTPASLTPRFTYPIFGEAEKIFGYKNLSVDITFAGDSLLSLLEIKWDLCIKQSLDIEVEDLDAAVSDYLGDDVLRDRSSWETAISEQGSFVPAGSKIKEYVIKGVSYVIYKSSTRDQNYSEQLGRMQIFSMLYIEGASLIDIEDDRFDVFTIYVSTQGRFEFVGYCTCYKYYFFDKIRHSFDFIRYRISQFVILPNHQTHGHGGRLYDAITDMCLNELQILEVTVEDPSEAFDDLRDRRDLVRIIRDNDVAQTLSKLPVSSDWFNSTQRRLKIAPKQFARLVEMLALQTLEKRDLKQCKLYKYLVKSRLYKKNRDVLAELNGDQRREKVEETYQAQIADYERLWQGLEGVPRLTKHAHVNTGDTASTDVQDPMEEAMTKRPRYT